MPTWTGLVIGWIMLCTDVTPPNGRWGNPPVTLHKTQAACVQSTQAMQAAMAKLYRTLGKKNLESTCWCEHVTPAGGRLDAFCPHP